MGRFLIAALSALVFVSVGCQGGGDKHDGGMHHKGDAMKASADACSQCPGMQKATADGKCPVCGMSMSGMKSDGMMKSGNMAATQASSEMDACTHCAGMQTASAEGKCPGCGMEVAKK